MNKRPLRHGATLRLQRGAALLMAMLTVTLVATFAAASLWQQWRSVEVEAAERSRTQSSWVLTGALDWARLILREDRRSGGNIDHLGEPWAVPLQESRLSTFLAADRDHVGGDNDEGVDAFLSGQIIDLQSRMNVNDLIDGATVSEVWRTAFAHLFQQLNLPQPELELMIDNLRRATLASKGTTGNSGTGTGTETTGAPPLLPARAEDLGWLGLSPGTVRTLLPFVTVLQSNTTVNLNTASAEVLSASMGGLGMADAQRLVTARARTPFRSTADATGMLNASTPINSSLLGVSSSFFEVQGRLRLGATLVIERSLVQRDSNNTVTTLRRERAAADAGPTVIR